MDLVQSTINFPVRKTRSQVKKKLDFHQINDENVILNISPKAQNAGSLKSRKKGSRKSGKDSIKPASIIYQDENVIPTKQDREDNSSLQTNSTSPKRTNSFPIEYASKCNSSPPKRARVLGLENGFKTPHLVTLAKQDVTPYQKAKQALHTSTPSRLLCRDNELSKLEKFLSNHLNKKSSGCLYISGAPGTGKTACLQLFIDSYKAQDSFTSIFINCMTMRQSKSMYDQICEDLGCPIGSSIKDATQLIEKKLTSKGKSVVMVLDEMDQLSTKNQEVLYTIFEWPRLTNSRLILIGVANALDLTDRLLPRLHACGSKPQLLHFMPYSQNQIQEILKERLKGVSEQSNVIKPEAVQFCARKIAASTGDIRKALDTCRRALDIAEKGAKSQQILKTTSDDCCNEGSPRKSPMKRDLPPSSVVGLPQIMSVLHDIYNSQVLSSGPSKSSEFDSTLPIQQKLLLCALLLLVKHSKVKDITIGKLHEVHCRICRKRQIGEVASSEFFSLCDLVESRGLINLKKGKEARLTKVLLKANEDDLQYVLQDKNLLATVLSDHTVLKH